MTTWIPSLRTKLVFTSLAIILLVFAFTMVPSASLKKWRAQRYANRAAALASAGVRDGARSACLKALSLNPNSLSAIRELLDLISPNDVQDSLLLRAHVADLDPADHANLERLVRLALAANRLDLAAKAVRDLTRAEGETVKTLELRASVHLARGNLQPALQTAEEILAREPQNINGRMAKALAHAYLGVATEADEAVLIDLSSNTTLKLTACRGLRDSALHRKDEVQALKYAHEAASSPDANFADTMIEADLAVQSGTGKGEDFLPTLTTRAGRDPAALGRLARWLEKTGGAENADRWISASTALASDPVTSQMIRSELLMSRGKWKELRSLLSTGKLWGSVDFLRIAVLARAARADGDGNEFVRLWREASAAALASEPAAWTLANLTREWPEWQELTEQYLWAAAEKGSTSATWALPDLEHRAEARRDISALLRVARAMCRLEPAADTAMNNRIFYSLLLNSAQPRDHQTIDELAAKHPADPTIVSTQALSLLKRGKTGQALEVLEKLPAEARDSDDLALYYGLALSVAGKKDEAQQRFIRVRADRLLPQERALLEAAKKQ